MLKEIILSIVDTKKVMVFLFGSRVSGRHSLSADADIGLLADEKLPANLYHNEIHGVESVSPKMAMKQLYRIQYANEKNYETLIEMINDRNRLSHVYNEEQFNEIYSRITEYLKLMQVIVNEVTVRSTNP